MELLESAGVDVVEKTKNQHRKIPSKPYVGNINVKKLVLNSGQLVDQIDKVEQGIEDVLIKDESSVEVEQKQIITYRDHALRIYADEIKIFSEACQILKENKQQLNSIEYGQKLKEAENALNSIQIAFTLDSSCGNKELIEEMKESFEGLCRQVPIGDSVLLKRDVDQLQRIFSKPENKTYISDMPTTFGIKYHEPDVSLAEITSYFKTFSSDCGYVSIAVNMQTEGFYDLEEFKGANFTLIGFKRPEKYSFSYLAKWLPSAIKTPVTKEDKRKALEDLLENQYSEWGYDSYKFFHMSVFKERFDKKGLNIANEWSWCIMLYHKKF